MSGKLNGVRAATRPFGNRSTQHQAPSVRGSRSNREDLAADSSGFFGGNFERHAGAVNLGAREGDRLSGLGHDGFDEFLAAPDDPVSNAAKDRRSPVRGDRRGRGAGVAGPGQNAANLVASHGLTWRRVGR